jgi:hypothetical protein
MGKKKQQLYEAKRVRTRPPKEVEAARKRAARARAKVQRAETPSFIEPSTVSDAELRQLLTEV